MQRLGASATVRRSEGGRRVYSVFAHFYDAVVLPLRRLRHEVASIVDLRPGAKLLDAATGTGAQALAFAPRRVRAVRGIASTRCTSTCVIASWRSSSARSERESVAVPRLAGTRDAHDEAVIEPFRRRAWSRGVGTDPTPIIAQSSGALYGKAFAAAVHCDMHFHSGMIGVVRVVR